MSDFVHRRTKKMSAQKSTQQSNVLSEGGGITAGRHRIHVAYIWINILKVLPAVIIALVAGFAGSFFSIGEGLKSGDLDTVITIAISIAALILASAIAVVASLLYYLRFSWEITNSEINIYSGILFRKQVHIPFLRVQSIDYSAGIWERIAGIATLKIETAGGAANKGVVIPALRLAEAEALRAEIFTRKRNSSAPGAAAVGMVGAANAAAAGMLGAAGAYTAGVGAAAVGAAATGMVGAANAADAMIANIGDTLGSERGVFAGNYTETTAIEFEYGLTAPELLLAAVSSDRNLVFLLVIFGFLVQVEQFLSSININVVDAVSSIALRQSLPVILAFVVAIIVIALIVSVLATAVTYGGFKARRRGGRVEVERGLLARQYSGVAINRIQTLELHQGFIRRIFGYAQLRLRTIDAANASSQKQNANSLEAAGIIIHPFIKISKVDALLAGLLPEYNSRPNTASLTKLPNVALRRAIIRGCVLPAAITLVVLVFMELLVMLPLASANELLAYHIAIVSIYILVFGLALAAAILAYRHAGYGSNANMLVIRKGAFGIVTCYIPRQKIQWATVLQNPLQRIANVASIEARSAAGVGGTSTLLRDISAKDAQSYLDWIKPRLRVER
jgi:putative membrane protein